MKPTYEELEKKYALQQSKLAAINELMGVVEKASDIAKAGIEELQSQNADLAVQLANAESKCRELAGVVAENAALKKAAEFATAPDMWIEQADGMLDYRYCEWYVDVLKAAMETPATDAFLAEVRSSAIPEGYLLALRAVTAITSGAVKPCSATLNLTHIAIGHHRDLSRVLA